MQKASNARQEKFLTPLAYASSLSLSRVATNMILHSLATNASTVRILLTLGYKINSSGLCEFQKISGEPCCL